MAATPDDERDDELRALKVTMAEHDGWCRAALTADVVVHELSNVLNAVLLQAAVLRQAAAEPLRSELDSMRDQGRMAAAVMHELELYRSGCWPEPYPVDLNQVARSAAQSYSPPIVLDLAADLPPVLATVSDVRMLTVLLVDNATAVTPSGEGVRVRTSRAADTVRLCVEDRGPQLAADSLRRLFDAHRAGRPGANPLAMAACQMLARRLQAAIHAENRPDGVTLVVALKAWSR